MRKRKEELLKEEKIQYREERAQNIYSTRLKFHLLGFPLKAEDAILAKCAECMNDFVDGKEDCQSEDCPLYSFMPFSKVKKLSEEQRQRKIKEFYSNYDKFGNKITEETPKENIVTKE